MQFPHNNNVNTSSAPPALLDITSVPRRNESMVSFSKDNVVSVCILVVADASICIAFIY